MSKVKLANGYAYSGMEEKVEALAIKAAERYIAAKDYSGAARAATSIRRQYYKSYVPVRDDSIKPDLHSFHERSVDKSAPQTFGLNGPLADAVRRGAIASNARYDYLINQSLGINRGVKSAKDSLVAFASLASGGQKSPTLSYLLDQQFAPSGYSAAGAADTFIKSGFSQSEQINWDKQINKIARRTRMQANAQKLKDAHTNATANKVEQTNIQKGIWSAFGGRQMHFFRQLFGYGFGYGHIIRSLAKFAIGGSMASAERTQQTALTALATGTTFNNIYGFGGATKIFGGSEKDATGLFATINALKVGSLMGNGMGAFGNLLKYGVAINPFMSEEEIINSIAKRYSSIGNERGAGWQAMMASEGGIPPAIQKAMLEHPNNFYSWYKSQGPVLTEGKQNQLEEQARAQRELAVAWDEMMNEWAITLTPTVKYITGLIKSITRSQSSSNEALDYIKKHPDATLPELRQHLKNEGLNPNSIPTQIRIEKGYKEYFNSLPDGSSNPYPLYQGTTSLYNAPLQRPQENTYEINISSIADANSLAMDIRDVIAKHDHNAIVNLFSSSISDLNQIQYA